MVLFCLGVRDIITFVVPGSFPKLQMAHHIKDKDKKHNINTQGTFS